jgi:hypothetical protein
MHPDLAITALYTNRQCPIDVREFRGAPESLVYGHCVWANGSVVFSWKVLPVPFQCEAM